MRIKLFYSIIIIFTISIIVIFYFHEVDQLYKQTLSKTEYYSNELGQKISNKIEITNIVIKSISDQINISKPNLLYDIEKLVSKNILFYPQIIKINILDNDMRLIFGDSKNALEEDLYKDIFTKHKNNLTNFIISQSTINQNLIFSRAYWSNNNELLNVFISEINIDELLIFEEEQKNLKYTKISLLNNRLDILSSKKSIEHNYNNDDLFYDLTKNFLKLKMLGEIGGYKDILYGNHIISIYQLPKFPFYVKLESNSINEYNTIIKNITFIMLFIFGFYLILLLFYSYFDKIKKQNTKNEVEHLIELKKVNKDLEMNINQLKTSKILLKNSEMKFSTIFKQAPSGIALIDSLNGDFMEVNTKFSQIIGYTKLEIKELNLISITHPEDVQQYLIYMKSLNEGYISGFSMKKRYYHKNGSIIWIDLVVASIFYENAINHMHLAMINDITKEQDASMEKKILEEKLHHASKMDALGQVAGGIAHDFNNILNGILSAAQLLKIQKYGLDRNAFKYIDMIEKSSIRASDLTKKLLLFSQEKKLGKTFFNIDKVLDDTIEILKSTIDKKIQIFVNHNKIGSCIYGDLTAIQSVLMNLGINSCHAMMNGGKLIFETEILNLKKDYCDISNFQIEPGEFIKIDVTDTGNGISSENIKKIFEPFFSTKEQGKGTGLGLAVSYGTIMDHKGEITVKSKLYHGTKFTIYLPLSNESIIVEESVTKKPIVSANILFIDDEEFNRITTNEILESLGYSVILAKDGIQGVEIYKERYSEIDLVISDMMMPGMNGAEVFVHLREINPTCKIIIASGNTNEDLLQKIGVSNLLQKPYTINKLGEIIYDVLCN